MFKRFQVIDMFHGHKNFEVSEWVPVDQEMPKGPNGIYKVRLKNGDEIKAYYCDDKLISMMKYYPETKASYWYSKDEKKPLHDVTHWGKDD